MSTSKIALRDARIASLLRKCADELDPQASTTTTAPKAGMVKAAKEVRAVVVPAASTTGKACIGCGKALLSNTMCKTCRAKAGTEIKVAKAKVATVTAPKAAAKPVGRTSPKAHCRADKCGLFVKAGAKFCTAHTPTVVHHASTPKQVRDAFITLDDGKRGFRVPASMVIALRKAGLTDVEIITAAKAQGVGVKVSKKAGVF